jgi:septum formation topological specificity factor MinE
VGELEAESVLEQSDVLEALKNEITSIIHKITDSELQ